MNYSLSHKKKRLYNRRACNCNRGNSGACGSADTIVCKPH